MLKQLFLWVSENYLYISGVAVAAGVSCLKQVLAGKLKVGWVTIGLHFSTSIFFGWVLGNLAYSMGYETPNHIAVAASIGAYLGDGVIDLLYKFAGVDRRK